MIKTLIPVGDGVGIKLDEALLRELGIGLETPLDVSKEGQTLVIRPVTEDHDDARESRVLEAADRVMDIHAETLRKLAL